jgi:hypothetical protein
VQGNSVNNGIDSVYFSSGFTYFEIEIEIWDLRRENPDFRRIVVEFAQYLSMITKYTFLKHIHYIFFT